MLGEERALSACVSRRPLTLPPVRSSQRSCWRRVWMGRLRWVEAWLNAWARGVVINGAKNGWRPVMSGVPQGLILGPVLLGICVNEDPIGQRTPSVGVQMTQRREEGLMRLRVMVPSRGSWAGWRYGLPPAVQQGQEPGGDPGEGEA